MQCKVRNYHLDAFNNKIDDGQQVNIYFDETMFIPKSSSFLYELNVYLESVKGNIITKDILYGIEVTINSMLAMYKYKEQLFLISVDYSIDPRTKKCTILYASEKFDLY